MAKKYFNNYKLDIAIEFLFCSIEADEYLPIHDVIELESGDTLPKHQMKEGNYFVYGGGGKTENQHNKFNLDFDTIGIGRVGARCGCIFNIEKKSWVTDNLLYVKEYDKRFSLNFLKHFLRYSNLNKYANNAMQPVISKTGIQSVKIPLLNYEKQIEIGHFIDEVENDNFSSVIKFPLLQEKFSLLDKIDVLNDENATQSQLISQLRQSILQEAIQGKLTAEWREQNPNVEPAAELLKRIKAERQKAEGRKKEKPLPHIAENEIPFELPEGWVWCRLGETSYTIPSKTFQILQSEISLEGNYPVISQSLNYIEGYSDKSDKICKLENPIVIFGDHTRNVKYIDFDFIVGADGVKIIVPFGINAKFFYFLVLYASSKIENRGYGRHFRLLEMYNFPLPPLSEQQAIVEKVETLLAKCNQLQAEIENLNKHSKDLLKALFNETFERKDEI